MNNVDQIDEKLTSLFKEKYSSKRFVGVSSKEVESHIKSTIGVNQWEIEGYKETELSLQQSAEFTWGHNHDFGDFNIPGRMKNRHTRIMAHFMDDYNLPFDYFNGKIVLDIGCWTGGTTLLLNALGALKVTAIEEVKKQAIMANWLLSVFGINSCFVEDKSLYEINYRSEYDIVYFPGVLYHLSDMLVALRILYNSLKVGGVLFLESAGREFSVKNSMENKDDRGLYLLYFGQQRSGFNWFVPSAHAVVAMLQDVGFDEVESHHITGNRLIARAVKVQEKGMCKAGLSKKGL